MVGKSEFATEGSTNLFYKNLFVDGFERALSPRCTLHSMFTFPLYPLLVQSIL